MKLNEKQLKCLESDDFYKGKYCIKNELPWFTPESIIYIYIYIDGLLSNNIFLNCLEIVNKYFDSDFLVKDFNHPKWAGGSRGTRIIYHKSLNL